MVITALPRQTESQFDKFKTLLPNQLCEKHQKKPNDPSHRHLACSPSLAPAALCWGSPVMAIVKLSARQGFSPVRTEKYPPPLMRFLRSNAGSRSKGRCRSSPMFVRKTIETQEPSSPRVTCIGQVQVRRSKEFTPRAGSRRSRHHCKWIPRHSFRLLKHKCAAAACPWLFKCAAFFSRSFRRKGKEPDDDDDDDDDDDSAAHARVVLEGETKEEKEENVEGDVYVFRTPPKNALLLTRCRSAPTRSFNFGRESESTPFPAVTLDLNRMQRVCSIDDGEESLVEKIVSPAESEEDSAGPSNGPAVLTRCRSEQVRNGGDSPTSEAKAEEFLYVEGEEEKQNLPLLPNQRRARVSDSETVLDGQENTNPKIKEKSNLMQEIVTKEPFPASRVPYSQPAVLTRCKSEPAMKKLRRDSCSYCMQLETEEEEDMLSLTLSRCGSAPPVSSVAGERNGDEEEKVGAKAKIDPPAKLEGSKLASVIQQILTITRSKSEPTRNCVAAASPLRDSWKTKRVSFSVSNTQYY